MVFKLSGGTGGRLDESARTKVENNQSKNYIQN